MKNLFFLLLMTLATIACDRNTLNNDQLSQDQLPAATQIGANTFGCMVNGKIFYPRDGTPGVGSNPKGVEFTALGTYPNYIFRELIVNNYQDGKPINNFFMHFQPFSGVGEYNWKQTNFKYGVDGINDIYLLIRAFDYNENIWKWYGSYESSGKTVISKYENGIFSGTFSGKLKTEDGKSEIEISNGRFDFNLFTLPIKQWP